MLEYGPKGCTVQSDRRIKVGVWIWKLSRRAWMFCRVSKLRILDLRKGGDEAWGLSSELQSPAGGRGTRISYYLLHALRGT